MTKFVNGKHQEESAADIAQRAIDDLRYIDQLRSHLKQKYKQEANALIAVLFGKPANSMELVYEEINIATDASLLLEKKFDGIITSEETTELERLRSLKGTVSNIRSAENDVAAGLNAAGVDGLMTPEQRVAELKGVIPTWP